MEISTKNSFSQNWGDSKEITMEVQMWILFYKSTVINSSDKMPII